MALPRYMAGSISNAQKKTAGDKASGLEHRRRDNRQIQSSNPATEKTNDNYSLQEWLLCQKIDCYSQRTGRLISPVNLNVTAVNLISPGSRVAK
jgi:hypothetical protein